MSLKNSILSYSEHMKVYGPLKTKRSKDFAESERIDKNEKSPGNPKKNLKHK